MFFIKKISFLLFSLIINFSIFPFLLSEASSQALQDYELIFKSRIFTAYTEQLQAFLEQSTDKQTLNPEFSLIKVNPSSLKERQALYTLWMQKLRTQLYQQHLSEPTVRSLHQLCYWRYTQPYLLPVYWNWLQQFGSHYSLDLEKSPNALLNQLSTLTQEILQDERLVSFCESESLDPHLIGHLPSFLYQLNTTRFIHTARTVIDSPDHRSSQVVPEFLGYLKQLKQEGQTHLYINLMLRTSKTKASCQALEALEKHPEVGDVIQVMTLDKTSNFYWQKAEFSQSTQQAGEFKQVFLTHLFDDSAKGTYKWPCQIETKDWHSSCQAILDKVHDFYFDHQPIFSKQEREIFIELTYLHLIEEVLQRYQPTYCNISCKHSVDRGPSILAIFYAYQRLKEGHWIQEDNKMLLTILLAPPLISHQRSPHTYRIQRFQQTFKQLLKEYR